jgi:hypothetical protein
MREMRASFDPPPLWGAIRHHGRCVLNIYRQRGPARQYDLTTLQVGFNRCSCGYFIIKCRAWFDRHWCR